MSYEIKTLKREQYVNAFNNIDSLPEKLYCIGDTSLLYSETIKVAVAGTRRASPYGRWVASELGKQISLSNNIYICGMAEGIQNTGLQEVLDNKGKAIIVLGTSIDVCYPKSASDLYKAVAECGLIISEYEPNAPINTANFVQRNRLITALSDKVVVVEGSLRSGAEIASRFAITQGKELYAVPGNINQPNAELPNLLIDGGAIPIRNIDCIASILGLEKEN